jgi:hypothetical protein
MYGLAPSERLGLGLLNYCLNTESPESFEITLR